MKALVAAGTAVLAVAAAAAAAGEPEVFGHARVGSLSVRSGALVTPRAADLRGVWNDEHRPCSEARTLRVTAEIEYIPTGRRVVRRGAFRTSNCAEGDPNMGFTISARSIRLACPNGTWKPGRYFFLTRTLETKSKLEAVASVGWEKQGRCR